MQDRVIANTLERATSTDFNDAQSMQARRPGDILLTAWQDHAITLPSDSTSSVTWDMAREIVTGLKVYNGILTTGIMVSAGTLTVPIAPADRVGLDGMARTGFLRADTLVPYVNTPGLGLANNCTEAFHLLCARPVDVITLTDDVDIWDVPTQQFVVTALQKKVETRIEFQWVLGTANTVNSTVIPNPDQAPAGWYPIALVNFNYPSGTENKGQNYDIARRVEGRSNGWIEANKTAVNLVAPPVSVSGKLCSAVSPDGRFSSSELVGSISGAINGERVFWGSSQDDQQCYPFDATDGSAPVADRPIHYYLIPMVGTSSGLRQLWPLKAHSPSVNTTKRSNVQRGLLVASTIQPTRKRTNSASITPYEIGGSRGKYAALAPVANGMALYVGSGIAKTSGVWDVYPFMQTVGGGTMMAIGGGGSADYLCPEVLSMPNFSAVAAINAGAPLVLAGKIPNCASAVFLHVEFTTISVLTQTIEIRTLVLDVGNQSGPLAFDGQRLAVGKIDGDANDAYSRGGTLIRVPLGWTPTAQHQESAGQGSNVNYFHNLTVRRSSTQYGSDAGALTFRLAGWDL